MNGHENLYEYKSSLKMNCDSFGDPLTFHQAPSKGQMFNLSNTLYLYLFCQTLNNNLFIFVILYLIIHLCI